MPPMRGMGAACTLRTFGLIEDVPSGRNFRKQWQRSHGNHHGNDEGHDVQHAAQFGNVARKIGRYAADECGETAIRFRLAAVRRQRV